MLGLLFSGQGSQYAKMGRDLYDSHAVIREVYDMASEVFGFDVIKESESGENFSRTSYSQPCVFTLSISILEYLKQNGFKYDGTAGFSLGECTALYGSGITTLHDTIKIVNYRSQAMEKASNEGNGAMAAVLGLSDKAIEDALKGLGGFCVPVNYNCDGQTVIAGDSEIIELAEPALKEAGAKRVMRLAVSSAFHTKYMDKASLELKENIKDINFSKPSLDFYTNINGKKQNEIDLPNHLRTQMISPVYFKAQIENMIKAGYGSFVEIGPEKTLSGFVKRINKEVNIQNIENCDSLFRTASQEKEIKI